MSRGNRGKSSTFRLVFESDAVHPTPMNRHERRAAAAKARKGGW